MQPLSQNLARKRPATGPSKYRYLSSRYVREFFADGSLLFTTYEKCRTHEDLTRRDSREGKTNFHFPHGRHAVSGTYGVGKQSYVLCTSSTLDDRIMSRFQADNWIEILDPHAFASAVSRAVPGFIRLQMAPCRYVADRVISRVTPTPLMPDSTQLLEAARSGVPGALEAAFHALNQQLANRLENELGDATYFLKEADPFVIEDEFRFVWTVDHEVRSPAVFRCPEAVEFCAPGRRPRE